MGYEDIRNLIYKGEFDKGNILMEKLSHQDPLKGQMLECALLFFKEEYQDAIQLASEVIQKGRETGDRIASLAATHYALFSLLLTNNFKEFAKFVNKTEDLLEVDECAENDQYDARELVSMIFSMYGVKEMYTGNISNCIALTKKGLTLATELESPVAMCAAIWVLSLVHQQDKAQAGTGLEYANRLHSIAQEHDLKLCILWAYHALISCYRQLGDLENSMKYASLGIPLGKKIGFKWITDMMIGEAGHHSFACGDYNQAMQHFNHAFKAAQERKDHWQMAVHLINIGHLYRTKGQLNPAINAFQQLRDASRAINNSFYLSYAFHALGTIHFDKGDFKEALKMFQESLHAREGFRNKAHLATTLLSLIQLSLELNDHDGARRYFSKLDEIRTPVPHNKNYQTNYDFARALLLKASPRMKEKAKAQEIFEAIANDEKNRHSAITSALLNLCDILIYEYKSTGEVQVLKEINSLSQKLYSIGKKKNDHKTTVKALLLQGKLSLLEGNLREVERLLEEALGIAVRIGLQNLIDQISEEQEKIKRELERWKSLLARNAPIRDRVEQAKLEEYIREAKRVMGDEQL